ncbi:MAG: tyrosine-type recombinase/integrase, partial [Candidatus Methanomethyliaceae archaeon]|nr:tyrosine-type recombinase/integrase [Candidatus Methanomethyliaceae archaeon]
MTKNHHEGLERINFRFKYCTITVPEYSTIKDFEHFCLVDRRLSTYSVIHYRSTVFRLILHANKPLKSLTKDDIRSFLSLFSNTNTYRNNLKALRVFCRDFLRRPDLVDSFRFPAPEYKPRFLPSRKQLTEFFNALDEEHERVLFLLYASTGLRRSEVLDLKIQQIDREHRAIIPSHFTTQKKSWIAFYNSETEALFHPWLDRAQKEKVFPLSSERKFLLFKKATAKTGLDITPQSLRFWFANEMARLGVPDRFIDAFQGRIPRSVLARHYTDYSLD